MTIEQKIRILLAHAMISQAELARKLGTTPSNLNQKIKRNSLTYEELCAIAAVTNAKWEAYFVLEDGTKV
jgi:transcriptional regulator with XRE-family HTH domain